MDFDQLKAHIALAEEGNFSRAAYRLCISQPAVSMKIRALEEELGSILFERSPRMVRLTAAGASLLLRARTIVREEELAREDLHNLQGLTTGTLRIACSENISRYYLAPRIAAFLQSYPAIEFSILNMPSPAAETAVAQGKADLAIMLLPTENPDLETHTVLTYRDQAVCSLQHPLAGRKRITLQALAPYRLLLLNPSTQSHRLLAQDFQEAGMTVSHALELGSAEAQKEFARIGLGVGIVPGYTLVEPPADLHCLQIQGLSLRSIALCKRPGSHSAVLEKWMALNMSPHKLNLQV